jgi:hypothetical protein
MNRNDDDARLPMAPDRQPRANLDLEALPMLVAFRHIADPTTVGHRRPLSSRPAW